MLLAVQHNEMESLSVRVFEGLEAPLAVRVPEAHADAVPRRPSAAAPPVALMLPVPNPLEDMVKERDKEGDSEAEELTLAEKRTLAVEHCEPESLSVWVFVGLEIPLPL